MRRALAVRHVAFEDAGTLAAVLRARGVLLEYVEAGVGAMDDDAWLAADLLVILGGPIGVYETEAYPFLRAQIAAIARRLAADKPTLGVCLGAQLMAAALGAHVAPGPAKEIGYAPLAFSTAGEASCLRRLKDVDVLHWHGDNLDLPAGATRLASTAHCPAQAFSIGARVLGLQFHLEVEPPRLERWLIGHAVELAKAGIDPRALRDQAARHGDTTARAGRDVFNAWLDGLAS